MGQENTGNEAELSREPGQTGEGKRGRPARVNVPKQKAFLWANFVVHNHTNQPTTGGRHR